MLHTVYEVALSASLLNMDGRVCRSLQRAWCAQVSLSDFVPYISESTEVSLSCTHEGTVLVLVGFLLSRRGKSRHTCCFRWLLCVSMPARACN